MHSRCIGEDPEIFFKGGGSTLKVKKICGDWLNCLHRLGVDHRTVLRALTVAGTLQSRASATVSGDFVTGDAVNDWIRGRAVSARWQDRPGEPLTDRGTS
ncbi:hypothetical protein ACWDBD_47655 [Streptomyces sp. NPDC001118]